MSKAQLAAIALLEREYSSRSVAFKVMVAEASSLEDAITSLFGSYTSEAGSVFVDGSSLAIGLFGNYLDASFLRFKEISAALKEKENNLCIARAELEFLARKLEALSHLVAKRDKHLSKLQQSVEQRFLDNLSGIKCCLFDAS